MIGILNTQSGDRYIFSGSAINTPPTATADAIINGTTTRAGLKQVIAERAQADGTTGLGCRSLDFGAGNFDPDHDQRRQRGFAVRHAGWLRCRRRLTGAPVTGPAGSPAAISIALGATNPNAGRSGEFYVQSS